MNLSLARDLAVGLMDAHGLIPRWGFEFDRALTLAPPARTAPLGRPGQPFRLNPLPSWVVLLH